MERWAGLLSSIGPVVRFDYPYMAAGRRRPDPHQTLLDHHLDRLDSLTVPAEEVVLIGKSMGSRIGCHVAEQRAVQAVVCLGYPLVSASGKLRDEVLRRQTRPHLFVQGTRDKMCPLDQLETLRSALVMRSAVHVVPTGDHSLQITKTHTKQTGQSQEDVDQAVLQAISSFLTPTQPE